MQFDGFQGFMDAVMSTLWRQALGLTRNDCVRTQFAKECSESVMSDLKEWKSL